MRLILFFTRGVSLRTWAEVGMLEREVAIYRRLRGHGVRVAFVTYGDASDLRYAGLLEGITIVCNRWRLPRRVYAYALGRFVPALGPESAVVKSNQLWGADVALRAARRDRNPFVARCGYIASDFAERQYGAASPVVRRARRLEQEVFGAADRIAVTTGSMRDVVVERYRVLPARVAVIPNYVDTELFRPAPDGGRTSKTVCFVGRLDDQKNPLALLEAIRGLDLELVMVGNGPLSQRARETAARHCLPVRFLGNVPHRQLPEILTGAAAFVLPSHYEGHPKALLEAMACGLPVIGTAVPGIRELIQHGVTGYLCGTSATEIRAALQEVLADAELRARIGRNVREFVVAHFTLDRVVEQELALLQEVAA